MCLITESKPREAIVVEATGIDIFALFFDISRRCHLGRSVTHTLALGADDFPR